MLFNPLQSNWKNFTNSFQITEGLVFKIELTSDNRSPFLRSFVTSPVGRHI